MVLLMLLLLLLVLLLLVLLLLWMFCTYAAAGGKTCGAVTGAPRRTRSAQGSATAAGAPSLARSKLLMLLLRNLGGRSQWGYNLVPDFRGAGIRGRA